MAPILEVSRLTKQFGGLTAVNNISFTIKEGEIVGLLGPNGAGKTTTLSMIMGIVTPTSGTIAVFGKDIETHREYILKSMNYSSAYIKAPWRLKVWEHLYVFALLYEVENPRKRVDEVLELFDLADKRNTLAGDLSSGYMARVNLAKAFINSPRVVLLDEPTSSLDPDIAARVREVIKSARTNFHTTLVMTSHNMAEIEELCDRVIFINHGKIIAEDTPEGLAKKIKKTRIRLMIRDGRKRTLEFCAKQKLTVSFDDLYVLIETKDRNVALVLNGLASAGVDYSEISIDKPTLEDFFIGEARHGN